MVDRHEIVSTSPCTVVDLDGTYIEGNTLKIYLQCGISHLLKKGKFTSLFKLATIILLRRLHLISHLRMKQTIIDTLYSYPQIAVSSSLNAKQIVNQKVKALINRNKNNGHKIIIATAAPDFYVRQMVGEYEYVASEYIPGKRLTECRGEEKLRRVENWMKENNCRLDTVVTDHHDDAPLITANPDGTNILVNPSKSTLRFFRKLQPTHFLLIEEIDDLGISR